MARRKALLTEVPPPSTQPTTKNELVAYLRETMQPELFALFSCAVVSEEVYEHSGTPTQDMVRLWWSLPNIGTRHVFVVEEKGKVDA